MNKEEILQRLEALEREGIEIKAEQENIKHLLSLVLGDKADAAESHLRRMQIAIDARIARWNKECDELEEAAKKLAA